MLFAQDVLGGQISAGTGPALSAWQYYQGSNFVNREDIFVKGTDGAMYQKTWTAASEWTTTWANLGGTLASSPTAATMQYSVEIYVRGTDGSSTSTNIIAGRGTVGPAAPCKALQERYSGGWHD